MERESRETKPALRMFELHMPEIVHPGAFQDPPHSQCNLKETWCRSLNVRNVELILNTLVPPVTF